MVKLKPAEFFLTGLYVLDNFSAHQIEWKGRTYPTVEHAYQAAHFAATDPGLMERVRQAPSPYAAAKLANFYSEQEDPAWAFRKLPVMETLLRIKLAAHEDVRAGLVESGELELVEANPADAFWGSGPDGKGLNWMGQLWMKLRAELVV